MKRVRYTLIPGTYHSNKTIFSYFLGLIVFVILINLLKWTYETYFKFESLHDQLEWRNLKSIQLLTGRFDFENCGLTQGLGKSPFEECPGEKRCFAYRSLLPIPHENADGVMVHGPNIWYLPASEENLSEKPETTVAILLVGAATINILFKSLSGARSRRFI